VASLLLLVPAGAALAQPRWDFNKAQIKVHKVAGNVYMLEGLGGNIGVSAGPDGILIVDDQFAPLAPKIKAALKGISSKPVRWLLNTHFHFDHTGGNEAFGKAGANIVAHENVRRRLQSGTPTGMAKADPAPVSALPVLTFKDQVSIHFNGEEIRALHLPKGHTDGDSAVFFTGSKVVHLGDHYFAGFFPFIDLDSGGSVEGFIANLEKVLAEVPADVKLIPGHGPVTGVEELKAYVAMLKDTAALVQAGIKAGKTADQLKQEKVLAKYDRFGAGFINTDAFTDTLFRSFGPAAK
jgi:glyoxylase-like metal-dependent hydrolase (beta-lactamase superfamily II)